MYKHFISYTRIYKKYKIIKKYESFRILYAGYYYKKIIKDLNKKIY